MYKTFMVGVSKYILTDKQFKAAGGEANIYLKDNTIFKIYLDKKKTIPIKKIQELQKLDRKNIIIPREQIFDISGNYVGFTMNFVENSQPICKLFSNAFWKNNNINNTHIKEVVKQLQETMNFIHKKKCLVVDANEFNFLIDETFKNLYCIDVDSYQSPSFPATAIMDSVRDWHTKSFTELSDWFSFGILACQLFIGLHPYKCKHPKFANSGLVEKMKSNISIFNKDSVFSNKIRDFSNIPLNYKEWFIRIFERGERIFPPNVQQPVVSGFIQQISKTFDNFNIEEIRKYNEDILYYNKIFNKDIVYTNKYAYIDDVEICSSKDCIVFVDADNYVYTSVIDSKVSFYTNKLKINNLLQLSCNKMFVSNNKLYIVSNDKLFLIEFKIINKIVVPYVKNSWNILNNCTNVYNEFCISDIFGSKYFFIPFDTSCSIIDIKELNRKRIINTKKSKNIIVVIIYDNGKYDRLILKFDKEFKNYVCDIKNDVTGVDISFASLDQGISLILDEDMTIFTSDINTNKEKLIKDKSLNASMNLISRGTEAGFFSNEILYKISIK